MINHPNRKRTSPSQAFTNAARARNFHVRIMWEIPGPKGTQIEWLSCYQVGLSICIVETFKDGNGWNVFTPGRTNSIDESVDDALARCDVIPEGAA